MDIQLNQIYNKYNIMNNWIQQPEGNLSLKDKCRELLKHSSRLVLVQQHELERILLIKRDIRGANITYIEELYEHYIVQNKPKTYLT